MATSILRTIRGATRSAYGMCIEVSLSIVLEPVVVVVLRSVRVEMLRSTI
jgi:hypothetical protein